MGAFFLKFRGLAVARTTSADFRRFLGTTVKNVSTGSSMKTCVKADKSAWQAGPREISGFQAIFGELFFLNFAALLLQERNQRISGDFWGAFFLKFRGLAVARMLFGRPFQCFFPFFVFLCFLVPIATRKMDPPLLD